MYSSQGGIVFLPRCPSYRIVAIEAKSRRDGRALKEVGYYDPIRGYVGLDVIGIVHLLNKGAQPSNTVKHLLEKARIIYTATNFPVSFSPGKTVIENLPSPKEGINKIEFNYKKNEQVLKQK